MGGVGAASAQGQGVLTGGGQIREAMGRPWQRGPIVRIGWSRGKHPRATFQEKGKKMDRREKGPFETEGTGREFIPPEIDSWTYHLGDLDRGSELRKLDIQWPPSVQKRLGWILETVADLPDLKAPILTEERSLSPRQPYLASPLSHLETPGAGTVWQLSGLSNSLHWNAGWGFFGPELEICLHDLPDGAAGVVAFSLTAGSRKTSVNPEGKGSFEIFSALGERKVVPVTSGSQAFLLDLFVKKRADLDAIRVRIKPHSNLEFLTFLKMTFYRLRT